MVFLSERHRIEIMVMNCYGNRTRSQQSTVSKTEKNFEK